MAYEELRESRKALNTVKSELNEARNLREKAQALLADYQRKKRDSGAVVKTRRRKTNIRCRI